MTRHSTLLHIKSSFARAADMCVRLVAPMHGLPLLHVCLHVKLTCDRICAVESVHGCQKDNKSPLKVFEVTSQMFLICRMVKKAEVCSKICKIDYFLSISLCHFVKIGKVLKTKLRKHNDQLQFHHLIGALCQDVNGPFGSTKKTIIAILQSITQL